MSLTIGADPEFWLVHRETGEFVSAHNVVPGTKKKPYKLKKGALQADGTAVEFNINPAETAEEFEENILSVLSDIRSIVPHNLRFDFTPVREYPAAYWDRLPDMAKEIGCDPEMYLYEPLKVDIKEGVRGIGGHIHVGWTEGKSLDDPSHQWDCKEFVSQMVYNMAEMEGFFDQRKDRPAKTGYGQRGSYRVKPYGVELRTWSSRWLLRPDLWKPIFYLFENSYKEMLKYGYVNIGTYRFVGRDEQMVWRA